MKETKTLTNEEMKGRLRHFLKLHRAKKIKMSSKLKDNIAQFISIQNFLGWKDTKDDIEYFIEEILKENGGIIFEEDKYGGLIIH